MESVGPSLLSLGVIGGHQLHCAASGHYRADIALGGVATLRTNDFVMTRQNSGFHMPVAREGPWRFVQKSRAASFSQTGRGCLTFI
jgi:hypothetical protein